MLSLTAGELTPIATTIWRLLAPNPSMLTGPGTNTYLLKSKSGLLVLDPGPEDKAHLKALLQASKELGLPITDILVTHTHTDHSPNAQLLMQHFPQAKLIGPETPNDGLQDEQWQADQLINDGDIISLANNEHLRAIATPGHVGNHFCYLHEPSGILFTGDHLIDGSTVVIAPPSGCMSDYFRSLKKLQGISITQLAPGHGNLIEDPQTYIEATLKHRLIREGKVLSALTNKKQTLDELLPIAYDDTPVFLHPLARYSLWAHALKLVDDGKVINKEESWWLADT